MNSRARSYYELLGVSRTATSAEIRSAYVRLMKRYHPDIADEDGAPDYAPILNRCYAILRNPERRAQYDAQLLRVVLAPTAAPRLTQPVTQSSPRRQWKSYLLLAGTAAAAWLVVGGAPDLGLTRQTSTLESLDLRPLPRRQAVLIPLPQPDQVHYLVSLAQRLPYSDAEVFSRRCYDSARNRLRMGAEEQCVLFDTAFLYWRPIPKAGESFSAYFADQVVQNRHREAVAPFGTEAEARLVTLREVALMGLVGSVRAAAPRLPPIEVGSAAILPVGDDKISADGELSEPIVP